MPNANVIEINQAAHDMLRPLAWTAHVEAH